MSASRAHALTERARGRLEKALGALLVARIGLQACPELGTLLGDWDGRLTEETRDLIARHVEQCDTCAGRRQGTLRQAALSGLQPLVPLPPGLREQVLKLCSSATPDVVAYRQHATRRAESVWRTRVSQVITLMKWGSIRANPGRALAVVVVVIWVVAAVSFTMLTFGGSHPARALAARASVSPSPASAAALATPTAVPAAVSQSVSAKPSASVIQSRTAVPPSSRLGLGRVVPLSILEAFAVAVAQTVQVCIVHAVQVVVAVAVRVGIVVPVACHLRPQWRAEPAGRHLSRNCLLSFSPLSGYIFPTRRYAAANYG